jgi:hypothetical protein
MTVLGNSEMYACVAGVPLSTLSARGSENVCIVL